MTETEILTNLRDRMSIDSLRPMQLEMLHTDATHVMLLAPTGTGKTIAFAAFVLRHVSQQGANPQAVVLTPSRELTLQVCEVLRRLGTGLKTVALYGGHSMEEEKRSLSVMPAVIVATPGRLVDHLNRGTLDIATATTAVIDEYDKCLEMGFAQEMRKIVRRMPKVRYITLTSATPLAEWPDYLPSEGWTTLAYEGHGSQGKGKLSVVEVPSESRDKLDTLEALLDNLDGRRVMVFVNHRESAQRVYDTLKRDGYPVGLYHGALDQYQREASLEMLSNGSTPILVTTDLASRGIDIAGMDAVVHYHIPPTAESWVHRNGRTARNGAEGVAYVVVSEADNVPDYMTFDREYRPQPGDGGHVEAPYTTLHLNLGKKEKISRGDVVGFLVANTPLEGSDIGKIMLGDHYTLVAVATPKAAEAVEALKGVKLKKQRVRVGFCALC